jgi:hypothetical protein
VVSSPWRYWFRADPRWESEVEYGEREQEEAGAQRQVDDVFGTIAKRDPSNKGQRHS